VKNGLCDADSDITVRLDGGDLVVNVSDGNITLSGDAVYVYSGEFEY
jgi:diaminopimelate epimerase